MCGGYTNHVHETKFSGPRVGIVSGKKKTNMMETVRDPRSLVNVRPEWGESGTTLRCQNLRGARWEVEELLLPMSRTRFVPGFGWGWRILEPISKWQVLKIAFSGPPRVGPLDSPGLGQQSDEIFNGV